MIKKFKIITLGCKVNQWESQAFSKQLKALGCIASDEDADFCIVNTCSVTKTSDKKSFQAIKSLKEKNKKAKFYITGCIDKNILNKLGFEIDFIPNDQKKDLVSKIFPNEKISKYSIINFDNHTRAFVKVQDGCNSFCSYCIIPKTRGRSISRASFEILDEINALVENGYQEIVLAGINIGEYQSDVSLEELLLKIEKIDNLKRIKISSIDPIHVSDKLIDILTSSNKIISSLHLVLQSGSEKILKKMNRKYTPDLYLEKVNKIISIKKDFTFTTDVIVGFPLETEKDFQKTINMIRAIKFIKAHIFPYSKRPNTLASSLDELDKKIITERKKMLELIAKEVSIDKRKEFLGKKMFSLFENPIKNISYATTMNNLNIKINYPIEKNLILEVYLENIEGDYIIGKICK